MMEWYPLIFEPIYKEKIWGGSKLNELKSIDPAISNLGESWEISDVDNTISIVKNGVLAGTSIKELLGRHGSELLGKPVFERFGSRFPLLIKYIDTAQDLSIQLHPDDQLAQNKHDSFGKTEMWYIMDASPEAQLTLGFKEASDEFAFAKAITSNQLPNLLNKHHVTPGESFVIKPGFVHAIGAGITLAEIQQSSDITYRVHDYGREDAHGNQRELHVQEAIAAADYSKASDYQLHYDEDQYDRQQLVKTIYFKTDILRFKEACLIELSTGSSFTILMNVGASCELVHAGKTYGFEFAQTYLIPAAVEDISVVPHGEGKLLVVSV
ncbi:type I phosphomannose isomerase catalytic subunit [Nonlabens sp. YIK11]|uniref:type I phosphomannose isomerase catalytic subunit n=1 Tax=Nonlabens sp. YIK11 TaxID=1453349 RepID=UPI0009EC2518|nr:type I phosphomannose isomerase catalytic subunit [Nonlabens sp. YIK11]